MRLGKSIAVIASRGARDDSSRGHRISSFFGDCLVGSTGCKRLPENTRKSLPITFCLMGNNCRSESGVKPKALLIMPRNSFKASLSGKNAGNDDRERWRHQKG